MHVIIHPVNQNGVTLDVFDDPTDVFVHFGAFIPREEFIPFFSGKHDMHGQMIVGCGHCFISYPLLCHPQGV